MPPPNERRPRRKSFIKRKKVCRFSTDPNFVLDYKNPKILSLFITERGKIIPRRITGTSARYHRALTIAIRRARLLALLPYTTTHANTD